MPEAVSVIHFPAFLLTTSSTMPRRTSAQCKEPQPQELEMPSQKLVEPESADNLVEEAAARSFVVEQPQKKKYRPSKRDIPDYQFTDAQISEIVEFVKQHPCLYSKRDKQWCNPRLKETMWTELAANFTDCSFLQVRKFFEKKRTDFGKIEKREREQKRCPCKEQDSTRRRSHDHLGVSGGSYSACEHTTERKLLIYLTNGQFRHK